jgi:DNA-binding transcriptional LysR family regulator
MDQFDGISVFVQVADSGSYVAAGRVLGLSASAVGKAIVRLEARLDVRLFHRNNRSIGLTPEGTRFLEHCRIVLGEMSAAEDDLALSKQGPHGTLRVSLPLVSDSWNRVFLDFMTAFPKVELELSYTNRLVDLVEEGFDVVLRIGELPDSRLRARKIGAFSLVLVASPDYLARNGTPDTLDDLDGHACLRSRNASTCRIYDWPLGPDFARRSARLTNRLVVDHNAMLIAAALNGYGIACVPGFWAQEHIASGALRQILKENTTNSRAVAAVWPAARGFQQKLSAFVDFLAEHLPAALGNVTATRPAMPPGDQPASSGSLVSLRRRGVGL